MLVSDGGLMYQSVNVRSPLRGHGSTTNNLLSKPSRDAILLITDLLRTDCQRAITGLLLSLCSDMVRPSVIIVAFSPACGGVGHYYPDIERPPASASWSFIYEHHFWSRWALFRLLSFSHQLRSPSSPRLLPNRLE